MANIHSNTTSVSNPMEMQKMKEALYQISLKFLGWSKILAAFMYTILYAYSLKTSIPCTNTSIILTLQVFLIMAAVITIIYGSLVTCGAYQENVTFVDYSLPFCVGLAILDMFIGLLGIIIYSSGADETNNFFLLLVYIFILLQLLWLLCYDFPQIMIYKNILISGNNGTSMMQQTVRIAQTPQVSMPLTRNRTPMQTTQMLQLQNTIPNVKTSQFDQPAPREGGKMLQMDQTVSAWETHQTLEMSQMQQSSPSEQTVHTPQVQQISQETSPMVQLTKAQIETMKISQMEHKSQTLQMPLPQMTETQDALQTNETQQIPRSLPLSQIEHMQTAQKPQTGEIAKPEQTPRSLPLPQIAQAQTTHIEERAMIHQTPQIPMLQTSQTMKPQLTPRSLQLSQLEQTTPQTVNKPQMAFLPQTLQTANNRKSLKLQQPTENLSQSPQTQLPQADQTDKKTTEAEEVELEEEPLCDNCTNLNCPCGHNC